MSGFRHEVTLMDDRSVKVTLHLANTDEIVDKIVTDDVGVFLAETVARYMSPYVPMDTGMLYQGYITEPWKITYTQPYAHYQFYGDNFNFNKEHHPLATSHWDVPTQAAYSKQIADEVTEFIKRKGSK